MRDHNKVSSKSFAIRLLWFASGLLTWPVMAQSVNLSGFTLFLFTQAVVDFRVTDRMTIGPTVEHLLELDLELGDSSPENISFLAGGAAITFYLSSKVFSDSWIISPWVDYGLLSSGTARTWRSGLRFGYAWFWPSGFNVVFCIGPYGLFATHDPQNELKEIESFRGSKPFINSRFTLGMAF
jgi:hypothetical protein